MKGFVKGVAGSEGCPGKVKDKDLKDLLKAGFCEVAALPAKRLGNRLVEFFS